MALSKRRQFNTLLAYLKGLPIRAYARDDFDPHVWQLYNWLATGWQERPTDSPDDNEYRRQIMDEMLVDFNEERQHRIALDLEAVLLRDQAVLSLEDLAKDLRPVSWLWEKWLPVGMITILAARPGTGKSLVALDIVHRVIAGETWPDGTPVPGPGLGAVVWVEGENNPAALNERAAAWDMPRDHIYPLLPTEKEPIIDLSSPLPIADSIPQESWQERLTSMVRRLDPRLIIVDSLSTITRRGEGAIEEVRDLMGFLNSLAVNYEVPILLIHHLRKMNQQLSFLNDGDMDMDMVRGSGHLAAMARVIWGLSSVQTGPEPDLNGPRKLQVIKTNISGAPAPLGLTLEPIITGDHDETGVRLAWSLKPPKRYQEPTTRDKSADWLIEYLEAAGEPVSPKDVIEAAQAAGFSRAGIYRAHDELVNQGIVAGTKGRKNPDNLWQLSTSAEPESE